MTLLVLTTPEGLARCLCRAGLCTRVDTKHLLGAPKRDQQLAKRQDGAIMVFNGVVL